MARNTSPVIAEADASLQASRADLQSADKDLFPTLSAGYTYQRQFDNSFSTFLSITQRKLFLLQPAGGAAAIQGQFPAHFGGHRQTAGRLLQVSRAGRMNDLFLNVNQAYFNHLRNLKLQDVAGQALERLQSHLKDSRAFFEAGLIPKNDLLQSEVQLSQGQLDLLEDRKRCPGLHGRLEPAYRPARHRTPCPRALSSEAKPITAGLATGSV